MNVTHKVDELQMLVRVGLSPTEARATLYDERASTLHRRISALLAELSGAKISDEFVHLKLCSLSAEFHYNFGGLNKAIKELETLTGPAKLLNWDFDKRYFAEDPYAQQPLMRQRLWGAMAIAHYGWYKDGRIDDALRLLKQVLRAIKEIDIAPRRPHGTWCRCHYFIAHCHRSRRDFDQAEEHFLKSQYHAQERLKRQLLTPAADKEEEYLVATICSARILGAGLSWAAIQQGQLRRALHMLRTADTLLEPTGQEGLKLFVRSLIGFTLRRLFQPGTTEWNDGMEIVSNCLHSFELVDDRRGIRRCLQELTRAHLDAASNQNANLRRNLTDAALSIGKLERLGRKHLKDPWPEHFRASLLRTHLALLGKDLRKAELSFADATDHQATVNLREHPDDNTNFAMTEGMLAIAQGKLNESIACFQRGLLDVEQTLDPVLEAECLLRLALAYAKKGDIRGAREHLQRWEALERFVDNFFLRAIRHQVYAEIAAREEHPTIIFKTLRSDDAESWFHQELVRIALAKNNGNAAKARAVLDLPRSTFRRWQKGK